MIEQVAARTWDAVERFEAERALRESEERLRSAAEVGRLGLWDWNVPTGEIHWSDEHFRMEGYAVGEVTPTYETWASRIHPDDRPNAEAALRHAMEAHEEFAHEFRTVHPDGSVHWLHGRGRFFYDEVGQPIRMVGAMVETTERREWEEQQKVLVNELQHRTRNLLGVVRSVAQQTLKNAPSLDVFRSQFNDRLAALSRVQGLLSRSEHEPITLRTLIQSELDALAAADMRGRISLDGPAVALRKATVQTFALALHELATNARKYGALTADQGRLTVTWLTYTDDGGGSRLLLEWVEEGITGAGERGEPGRRGYGRELIEKALPYALQAMTSYELSEAELRCSIDLPLTDDNRMEG